MNLSTSLPEDLPWSEQQAFLLLDGATLSDLPKRLKTLCPGANTVALYDSAPFTALRDISPLLVAVQQPDEPLVQFYLEHAHEESSVPVLLELDVHLLTHFPERHGCETVAERWPMLEQLEAEASTLGLSSQSELFYYANVMASLDGSSLDQHPHINRLLHTPSLQSPGERVALAADLAHQWASQRDHP